MVAAMTSPMLQMRFGEVAAPLAATAINLMCLVGRGTDYAFGQGPTPYVFQPFEGNVLTGSEEEYLAYRALIQADPDLGLGGPTFGWLRAGLKSIARTRQSSYLAAIGCPVLLAQAAEEQIVDNEAIARAAAEFAARATAQGGRMTERFDIVFLTGWAPSPDQPKPARRGSGTASLAAALRPPGDDSAR